ncbi:MAG TPA: tripartite tricarboxylate transporter TctB family protein [Devosia sp.]|jgi:putative tricarboxylic transport membrane protein|nr:tripartite tricarboxylate transporter TctB family protein [Devosia sp.]
MDTPPPEHSTGEAIRNRADLLTAILLVALGIAVFYLSWTMPRLENRHIHPATIPGLVPLFLSVALTICGVLLGLRSARAEAPGGWQGLVALYSTRQALRVLVVLALALFHTLVLVGWLPFWAAAMIFVFAFIMIFETWLADAPANPLTSLIWAVCIAMAGGWGIFYVFERVFLVRLP